MDANLKVLRNAMKTKDISELVRENVELKNRIKQLENLLDYDALTGVKSHRSLIKTLERRQPGDKFLVVAFDLIDFGNYNKIYGHHEGDKLLKMFAEKLASVFRSTDRVYRRGGDEFVAILEISDNCEYSVIVDRLDKFDIRKFAYIGFAKSLNKDSLLEPLVIEAFGGVEQLKRGKVNAN